VQAVPDAHLLPEAEPPLGGASGTTSCGPSRLRRPSGTAASRARRASPGPTRAGWRSALRSARRALRGVRGPWFTLGKVEAEIDEGRQSTRPWRGSSPRKTLTWQFSTLPGRAGIAAVTRRHRRDAETERRREGAHRHPGHAHRGRRAVAR
jgi:hypothetical protein